MTIPDFTKYDAHQVLKGSFDEDKSALRTTIVGGELTISDENDSIKVGDGTGNYVKVNPDGSINVVSPPNAIASNVQVFDDTNKLKINSDGSVNVSGSVGVPGSVTGQIVKNIYNKVSSVSNGVLTDVVTYTVGAGLNVVLQRIEVSGENYAKYTVLLNGTSIKTKRTNVTNLNQIFEFITGNNSGYLLVPGDIVKVQVIHNRPSVGDFEASVQIFEI